MSEPIPVVLLSSIDEVLRDTAIFSALTGAPRTGVLRQDLDPVRGILHRVISDETGVAEDEHVPLEHTCLGCAIREDSLPSLERMVSSGRWDRILVAVPVAAPSPPLARPLADAGTAADIGAVLHSVATAVDLDTLLDNIFGYDLLAERDLALAAEDRRTVGEAVSGQLRHADLLLTTGDSATGTTGRSAPCGGTGSASRRSSRRPMGWSAWFCAAATCRSSAPKQDSSSDGGSSPRRHGAVDRGRAISADGPRCWADAQQRCDRQHRQTVRTGNSTTRSGPRAGIGAAPRTPAPLAVPADRRRQVQHPTAPSGRRDLCPEFVSSVTKCGVLAEHGRQQAEAPSEIWRRLHVTGLSVNSRTHKNGP